MAISTRRLMPDAVLSRRYAVILIAVVCSLAANLTI
jgi:hypothetical protein